MQVAKIRPNLAKRCTVFRAAKSTLLTICLIVKQSAQSCEISSDFSAVSLALSAKYQAIFYTISQENYYIFKSK